MCSSVLADGWLFAFRFHFFFLFFLFDQVLLAHQIDDLLKMFLRDLHLFISDHLKCLEEEEEEHVPERSTAPSMRLL